MVDVGVVIHYHEDDSTCCRSRVNGDLVTVAFVEKSPLVQEGMAFVVFFLLMAGKTLY